MKRFMAVFLAIAMTIASCGCGSARASEPTPTTTPIPADPARVAETYPVAESFAGGSGTAEDPYQIATAEQLALLSYMCTDEVWNDREVDDTHYREACYVLTADIELNDISDFDSWDTKAPKYNWTPIGEAHSFQGVFDGQGHVIRGMYIYSVHDYDGSNGTEPGSKPGLFGDVSHAEIRNLTVSDSYIRTENWVDQTGGVVASAYDSVLENSESAVTICTSGGYTGGVVGWCDGSSRMIDCVFTGEIIIAGTRGMASFGGVAGYASCDEIRNCRSAGVIRLADGVDDSLVNAAGLIGSLTAKENTTVSGCVNDTDLDLGMASVGGLFQSISCGDYDADDIVEKMTISDCVNNGDVLSDYDYGVGGIAAVILNTGHEGEALVIEECVNNGDVTGEYLVGGLFGYISNWRCPVTVARCVNTGTVAAGSTAGGIVGEIYAQEDALEIVDCQNEGTVTADSAPAGGIAGRYFISTSSDEEEIFAPVIRDCVNRGEVLSYGGILGTGGILGSVIDAPATITIEGCVNEGSISGNGTVRAGGILGSSAFGFSELSFRITDCVNYGDISQGGSDLIEATEEVAVQEELTQEMLDSHNGEAAIFVLSSSSVGGIVAYCAGGVVENCVNAGKIYVSAEDQPVYSYEELVIVTELSKSSATSLGAPVFAGGICGFFKQDDEDKAEAAQISDCWYDEVNPAGVGFVLPGYEDYVQNVNGVDSETAMAMAEQVSK